MNYEDVITGQGIEKSFKNFKLEIPELHIPKGFATALIGENGAGKTTLINMLAGIRRDGKGDVTYFNGQSHIEDSGVKDAIGYTGTKNFFLPYWNGDQVRELMGVLFNNFNADKFDNICKSLNIDETTFGRTGKVVSKLSDGNLMKLMLATVFARDTKLLLLDEPASPLDPLMRDMLGDMIRAYLAEGDGDRSVVFSTHNISDMENVTDYIIIVDDGHIMEQGFVTDLKEKYIIVKGDKEYISAAKPHLVTCQANSFGFEGVALSENLDKFAGMEVEFDTPGLFDISVAIMKQNSKISMPEI
ncbi:MAG: ABC transporter ATP-binding protein [Eubacterium sp.]|nr:ABC transporter ATP-binding protein [Eubacterium sp.]